MKEVKEPKRRGRRPKSAVGVVGINYEEQKAAIKASTNREELEKRKAIYAKLMADCDERLVGLEEAVLNSLRQQREKLDEQIREMEQKINAPQQ